jgi:hypothetical protein
MVAYMFNCVALSAGITITCTNGTILASGCTFRGVDVTATSDMAGGTSGSFTAVSSILNSVTVSGDNTGPASNVQINMTSMSEAVLISGTGGYFHQSGVIGGGVINSGGVASSFTADSVYIRNSGGSTVTNSGSGTVALTSCTLQTPGGSTGVNHTSATGAATRVNNCVFEFTGGAGTCLETAVGSTGSFTEGGNTFTVTGSTPTTVGGIGFTNHAVF